MDIWITVTSIIRFNPLFMNIQLSWLSHFHVDRKHKKEHALDEWSWTRLKEGEHWFFSPHPLVNPLCGATCQVAWLTAITTRCSGSYNWTTPTEATCLSPWFCWPCLRSVAGNLTCTCKTFFSPTSWRKDLNSQVESLLIKKFGSWQRFSQLRLKSFSHWLIS